MHMHLVTLLDHLTAACGTPTRIDRQEAYRWDIPQNGSDSPIHICLTLESDSRRASIWVFNPDKPAEAQTEFFSVRNDDELDIAMSRLHMLCSRIPALRHIAR